MSKFCSWTFRHGMGRLTPPAFRNTCETLGQRAGSAPSLRPAAWLVSGALLALGPLAAPPASAEGLIQGTVSVQTETVGRGVDLSHAVIYLEGDGINITKEQMRATAEADIPVFTMAQREKTYIPHVLPVPVGSVVKFSNTDPFMHNVRSHAKRNRAFNVPQMEGMSTSKRFKRPEPVHISCSVHKDMSAYVVVLKSPFFAMATKAPNGSPQYTYEIPQVPPGTYQLTVWHEKLVSPPQQEVVVGPGNTRTVDVTFTQVKTAEE